MGSNLYEKLPERIKHDFWLPLAKEHDEREKKKKLGSIIDPDEPLSPALNDQQLIDKYGNSEQGRTITN